MVIILHLFSQKLLFFFFWRCQLKAGMHLENVDLGPSVLQEYTTKLSHGSERSRIPILVGSFDMSSSEACLSS